MITLKLNRTEQAVLLKLLDGKSCCDARLADLYEKIRTATLEQKKRARKQNGVSETFESDFRKIRQHQRRLDEGM